MSFRISPFNDILRSHRIEFWILHFNYPALILCINVLQFCHLHKWLILNIGSKLVGIYLEYRFEPHARSFSQWYLSCYINGGRRKRIYVYKGLCCYALFHSICSFYCLIILCFIGIWSIKDNDNGGSFRGRTPLDSSLPED